MLAKKRPLRTLIILILSLILLVFAIIILIPKSINQEREADVLIFLVPDHQTIKDWVQGWQNIAKEEGLHLKVVTDSDFIRYFNQYSLYPGVILADSIHQKASASLIFHLKQYVRSGGSLMLIANAATHDESGAYYQPEVPFASVLHIPYTTYSTLGPIGWSEIGSDKSALQKLGFPPGKYLPLFNPMGGIPDAGENFNAISSFNYGALLYPHYITPTNFNIDNTLLMTPDHQFIAGVRNDGKGSILFVNLPLTYLWSVTDALPLHIFLRYFAVDMLNLPILSMAPRGIGGIIMDFHVASKDSLAALKILKNNNIFNQGPYSVDISAGPDLATVGDKQGFDVANNREAQNWVHYFVKSHYAIGSQGGWMNNYFGLNVKENNKNEFEKYITMNRQTLESVSGQKVLEFAAPLENQPAWINQYLAEHGFVAYFSASNTGSPPLHNYYNGKFDDDNLWSFPLLPFGKYEEFEEFSTHHIPESDVTKWLLDSTSFVSSQHTIRLIYAQVAGADKYLNAWKSWLAFTNKLHNQNRFNWYTMVDIANFLNIRKETIWSVEKQNGKQIFNASNLNTLENQTWFIRKNTCQKPIITKGDAIILEDANNWIVVAGKSQNIQFSCDMLLAKSN